VNHHLKHKPHPPTFSKIELKKAVVDKTAYNNRMLCQPWQHSQTPLHQTQVTVSVAEDISKLPEYISFHATLPPELLQANLHVTHDDVACKGGVMPNLNAAFFASNTTCVPEPVLQQTAVANTDANEPSILLLSNCNHCQFRTFSIAGGWT